MSNNKIIEFHEVTNLSTSIELDLFFPYSEYKIYSSGAVVLANDLVITNVDNPQQPNTIIVIDYVADISFSGGDDVIVFGTVMPSHLTNKNQKIYCNYDGSSWDIKFAPDGSLEYINTSNILDSSITTSKINNQAVSTTKLEDSAVTASKMAPAVKKGVFIVPVSFETGEQGFNHTVIPFACTIENIYIVVTKAIAATDNATIEFKIDAVSMNPASATIPASTGVNNLTSVTVVAPNNKFLGTGTEKLTLETSKVTPGGKALVSVCYTLSS